MGLSMLIHFPNLALMRLSAWHKQQGDSVEWWNGFTHYDRVYLSKVFTFTPDFEMPVKADEIITGGTGYKDYRSLLPEVEATPPDYTIYPGYTRAIGFLTRGCIRQCGWCIVPRKEGHIRPAATWEEIRRPDSREIVFLDNNVLASDFGLEQIDRMGGQKIWVDFNQGLDARLIDRQAAGKFEVDTLCTDVLRHQRNAPHCGTSRSLSSGGRCRKISPMGLCFGSRCRRRPSPGAGPAEYGHYPLCPALPRL